MLRARIIMEKAVPITKANPMAGYKVTTQARKKMIRKTTEQNKKIPPMATFIRYGLPFVLFVAGASFVVASALDGKNKERDLATGQSMSKSERQAKMETERDNMVKKMEHMAKVEFDNTKRIERPEDILERRRLERENRNVWYKRLGRWMKIV
mmetsp:Transcript_36061/g.41804  ORF Transcript_36061/g.41804 Transcript_36061/m.41804 type:complete len:153 (+) Transcript_36061:218-676(+)